MMPCFTISPMSHFPPGPRWWHLPLKKKAGEREEEERGGHAPDSIFFFLKVDAGVSIYLLCLFMAVLGLRFCARAFSSCGERGPLFIAVRGPLTIVASLVGGAQAPDAQAQQLWLTGPVAPRHVGIFPDQGSNPCPLHRQADSQPLRPQGSPHQMPFKEGS